MEARTLRTAAQARIRPSASFDCFSRGGFAGGAEVMYKQTSNKCK